MKFLCVPCDSPMKLQTVGPPEAGSLSVVYACPECGYEMAMLTNAYETQVVQSLGVRIGPSTATGADAGARASSTSGTGCPFAAMVPGMENSREAAEDAMSTAEPLPVPRGGDRQREQQADGEDGLDHGEAAAAQRPGLQAVADEHHAEPGEPDAVLEQLDEKAGGEEQPARSLVRFVILQHVGRREAQRRGESEHVDHREPTPFRLEG